jgi:two-component system LytT family sensor kinase
MTKSRVRIIINTYIIITSWAFVGFLVRWFSGKFTNEFNVILFFVSLLLISITWEFSSIVNTKLNKFFPFERGIPQRILLQLSIGAVFALIVRYSIYKFGEPKLGFELDGLFVASTWVMYILASLGLNTIFFLKYFIARWKESILQTERLEKEKSQVQFDNLKNQLNPHFLFNALTSLNSLITENQQLASQFLQHMSKVYRYVLQNKDKNFVSLQTELDFIKNYVFLAETRFGGALKIKFEVSERAHEQAIVPVTLQILIENALKHNIVDHERPLSIDVFTSGDYLVISNNLQKRKTVETSNKLGLENLRSLYKFLTERPVIVEELEDRFNVKVPLI